MNIKEALRWAVDILSLSLSSTVESSILRLEAEVLLCNAMKQERIYLYTWPDKALNPEVQSLFESYIKRRATGEPIAYIIQEKEFWSLPLRVTKAVLVPRPETEVLVSLVLAKFPMNDPNFRLLELGTGSGAIAIALASERPDWQIIATDISIDALQVAKTNAKKLAIPPIQWLQGSWFEALPRRCPKFNVIVSNPPYIAKGDSHLNSELKYEPQIALVADNSGFFALQQIIQQAPQYLKKSGWIFLEHGATQAKEVRALLRKTHFSNIKTIKDLAGVNRVTVAQFKKA